MPKKVTVKNESRGYIWVLIDEEKAHLLETKARIVKDTDFETYYKGVVKGNIKCPIEAVPVEAGVEVENEFKKALKDHYEHSLEERYEWSGFLKGGETEIPPGKMNIFTLVGKVDNYYITVRSSLLDKAPANGMSRSEDVITIGQTGHINDQPRERKAIANEQEFYLRKKDMQSYVGEPKTGRFGTWDAGSFGVAKGLHKLQLVQGAELKNACHVRIISRSSTLQDSKYCYMYCSDTPEGWVYYDQGQGVSGIAAEKQQWILKKTSAEGNSPGDALCFGDTVQISNRRWKNANLGVKDGWLVCTRDNSAEWVLEP